MGGGRGRRGGRHRAVLGDVDAQLATQGGSEALLLVVLLRGQPGQHGLEALGRGRRRLVVAGVAGATGGGDALLDGRGAADLVVGRVVDRAGRQLDDLLREEPPQAATQDLLGVDDASVRAELVVHLGDGRLGGGRLDHDVAVLVGVGGPGRRGVRQ